MKQPSSRPPRIELLIDEVVWHGGREHERRAFAEGLERALARELASPVLQRQLARGGAEIRSIDAGGVPRVSGETVARAVSRGILNATRKPR